MPYKFKYNTIVSQWTIFGIEQIICLTAFSLSIFSIDWLHPLHIDLRTFIYLLLVNGIVSGIGMILLKTHSGIIRYSEIRDILTVGLFGLFQIISGLIIHLLFRNAALDKVFPIVIILNALLCSSMMIMLRLSVKWAYNMGNQTRKNINRIVIYGADEIGLATSRVLENESSELNKVLAFIDRDSQKKNKSLNGISIISNENQEIIKWLGKNTIDKIVIADHSMTPEEKNNLTDICQEFDIKLNMIPPPLEWVKGSLDKSQIRNVSIEAILHREPINIKNPRILNTFTNSTVMVSGAAGSIGSEICRHLRNYPLNALILIDQAETPLNSLYLELSSNNPHGINISTELLSIRETLRIDKIFKYHQPDYVFHAAAYKHVPLLETFPSEVVLTNVKGTINMADSAAKYGVKKFIMISTDKAVNPTNLMGACKRISELYVHGKNSNTSTQFITTRFGNVMGSQGSVVPLFREQIAKGGPVTITHPDITRYFMTIPEASNLVIEAGIMGSGGETFVFDMGEPVHILNLAKRMIVLAGLKPGKDIAIECIGLRPGEKMYEELFHSKEKQLKTHHPKILKSEPIEMFTLDPVLLEKLIQEAENHEMQSVKLLIPKLIPEYDQQSIQKDQMDKVKATSHLSKMNSTNIN